MESGSGVPPLALGIVGETSALGSIGEPLSILRESLQSLDIESRLEAIRASEQTIQRIVDVEIQVNISLELEEELDFNVLRSTNRSVNEYKPQEFGKSFGFK